MNDDTRQLGAFIFIAAGACAAVSLFVLAPLHKSNTSANERLSSAQAAAKQLGQLQPMGPLWDKQIADAQTINERYETHGTLAANAAALHSQVNRLARMHSIAISRIEPQTTSNASENASATGLSIQATGQVNQFTSFLDDLARTCGFTRIDSFTFTPLDDQVEQVVRASIRTSHFSFNAEQVAQAEPTQ